MPNGKRFPSGYSMSGRQDANPYIYKVSLRGVANGRGYKARRAGNADNI